MLCENEKIITVDNNMLNVDLVVFHDVLVLQNILFRLQSLKSTDGMTIIKVKKKDFLLLWDNNDVSKSLKSHKYY
jgi:regulator of protease activity HflC (stomatin/prohibitin superfamily)